MGPRVIGLVGLRTLLTWTDGDIQKRRQRDDRRALPTRDSTKSATALHHFLRPASQLTTAGWSAVLIGRAGKSESQFALESFALYVALDHSNGRSLGTIPKLPEPTPFDPLQDFLYYKVKAFCGISYS